MGNLVIKGNSQVLEKRRRISKREKGRSPNLLKESLVLNVMDMAISKRNVLIMSKSLALNTINERVEAHDSSDEDVVEKDVAYLAKIFTNFLNSRIVGNLVIKGNSQVLERRRRTSKREKGRSLNLLKESLVLNVMDMAISKRNVLII